jgi:hypothetical protein
MLPSPEAAEGHGPEVAGLQRQVETLLATVAALTGGKCVLPCGAAKLGRGEGPQGLEVPHSSS